MTASVRRKLTTILCADVEGYSRLMERDEVGTLQLLKQHRSAMAGLIERHHGRVVNTWGDGLIADFPSVVEAVQCAIETQRELRARNDTLPPERRLEFRIGINLGDVMIEDGDLYGEGVNVAARLQSLVEPGGIMISGAVHDQVRGKLSVGYAFAGQQQVKNIAEPVPAFRVTLDGLPEARRPLPAPTTDTPAARTRRRMLIRGFALIAFFFLLNVFSSLDDGRLDLWFQYPSLIVALVMALRWARTR